MKGLSEKAVKAIENLIKAKFDGLSLKFLGLIPEPSREKRIVFSTSRENILSLFLQSLGSRKPTNEEEEAAKVLMRIASSYLDGLRDKTVAKIIHDIDSHVRNKGLKQQPVSSAEIKQIINTTMDKAKNHFKLIVNNESNKAANVGTAMQISKLAADKGEDDPTVFFIVTVDDVTGSEEFVLHLLEDRKTPRVWKLSEIGSEYHKKGDPNPKFPGLHPNCRCKLTYLAEGWGFDEDGKVKFINPDWDEYTFQRMKYSTPRPLVKSEELDLHKYYHDSKYNKFMADEKDMHGDEHPENLQLESHKQKVVHTDMYGKNHFIPKDWQKRDEFFDSAAQRYLSNQQSLRTSEQNAVKQRLAGKMIPYPKDRAMSSIGLNSLNKLIANTREHPDRHVTVTQMGEKQDQHHMRLRHLQYLLNGVDGYSIRERYKPNSKPSAGTFMGLEITVDRHPSTGQKHQTKWLWDGKALKTLFHGKVRY